MKESKEVIKELFSWRSMQLPFISLRQRKLIEKAIKSMEKRTKPHTKPKEDIRKGMKQLDELNDCIKKEEHNEVEGK